MWLLNVKKCLVHLWTNRFKIIHNNKEHYNWDGDVIVVIVSQRNIHITLTKCTRIKADEILAYPNIWHVCSHFRRASVSSSAGFVPAGPTRRRYNLRNCEDKKWVWGRRKEEVQAAKVDQTTEVSSCHRTTK